MNFNIEIQAMSSGYPFEEIARGLQPANGKFLLRHPEWTIEKVYTNNGLTILRITHPLSTTRLSCHFDYNE